MLTLDKTNYQSITSSGVVVVDAWAPWCVQCKGMERVVEAAEAELSGKVKIGKINIADDMEFSSTLGIQALPTYIIYKDGKKVDMKHGMINKKLFTDWIASHV